MEDRRPNKKARTIQDGEADPQPCAGVDTSSFSPIALKVSELLKENGWISSKQLGFVPPYGNLIASLSY